MTKGNLQLKLFINNKELRTKYQQKVNKYNYELVKSTHPDAGFDLFIPDEYTIEQSSQSNMIDLGVKAALYRNITTCDSTNNIVYITGISSIAVIYLSTSWSAMFTICVGFLFIMYLLNDQPYVMTKNKSPEPFKLYPRSSMGSKTPLRLSNQIGVIDSGYRGSLMACTDNISDKEYVINKHDRLLQIVSFTGEPMIVNIVNSVDELNYTKRGDGGFGSTGR